MWFNTEVGHNREAKAEIKALFPSENPFSTPKPERLLKKIIEASTQQGDVVLDCFAGSGTTPLVGESPICVPAHERMMWSTPAGEELGTGNATEGSYLVQAGRPV
jgi:hypothetical protein